jgi:predicted DNA-binding transcriptional regulator YafY
MEKHYKFGHETSINLSGCSFNDENAEQAIKSKRRVWIKYKNEHSEVSERKIDIYYSKFGYFFGWCHLRNQIRTFKLSNVIEWQILEDNFEWNEETAAMIRKKAFED